MGKKSLALGRGLSDILKDHSLNSALSNNSQDTQAPQDSDQFRISEIELDLVDPNPFQPRKFFNDDELVELAETIEKHGLIQPIAVRKVGDRYQIISGERRTRASRLAGLKTIKAQVYDILSDSTMSEWALIENIQRVDLNPIEIAQSYQQLIENHGYTHEDLAKNVGKSRSAISNALRLLKLPVQVQAWIQEGKLSSGAARTLCSEDVKNPEEIARLIIEKGLSVREAEALLHPAEQVEAPAAEPAVTEPSVEKPSQPPVKKAKPELSADLKNFESRLEGFFGTKVELNPSASDQTKGTIVISYYSMDDLTRLQEIMENR